MKGIKPEEKTSNKTPGHTDDLKGPETMTKAIEDTNEDAQNSLVQGNPRADRDTRNRDPNHKEESDGQMGLDEGSNGNYEHRDDKQKNPDNVKLQNLDMDSVLTINETGNHYEDFNDGSFCEIKGDEGKDIFDQNEGIPNDHHSQQHEEDPNDINFDEEDVPRDRKNGNDDEMQAEILYHDELQSNCEEYLLQLVTEAQDVAIQEYEYLENMLVHMALKNTDCNQGSRLGSEDAISWANESDKSSSNPLLGQEDTLIGTPWWMECDFEEELSLKIMMGATLHQDILTRIVGQQKLYWQNGMILNVLLASSTVYRMRKSVKLEKSWAMMREEHPCCQNGT